MSRVNVKNSTAARPSFDPGAGEFLPFTRPSIDAHDIEEVVRVLQSGWITSGAKVRELEGRFCAHTGSEYAVAVCSATAGMHLALHAAGIGPGDEVITPSLTWVSTVNLIELSGAEPVFVDIDRNTLMADADMIAAAITPRTKLIIPVHYAGAPLDLDPIRRVALRHGIPVIEDAAHALGSKYDNVPVGRSGTAIFSLQAIKNVTTAEGGMICTDDAEFAERLRRLRFHGLGADAFDRSTQGRLPSAEVLEPGYKYNLPDMNAALGLGQMNRLQALNGRRTELANKYRDAFASIDGIETLAVPPYEHLHAWHLLIVRVDIDRFGISRDRFMEELKLRGIGTGLHFRAVHTHRYYRDRPDRDYSHLKNTNWNSDRIITLPLFPDMLESDVDRVVSAVEDLIAGSK